MQGAVAVGLGDYTYSPVVDEYGWDEDELAHDADGERQPDPAEEEATSALEAMFDSNRDSVFYSRQVEVMHEDRWFHWVTNRALRNLISRGVIHTEVRVMRFGQSIHLMWHRSYRFYKREAARLVALVEEYSDPGMGAAIGLHAELMVLEGFARHEFLMKGRGTRTYDGRTWMKSGHDLDFIFEKEGKAYGVEVKNTLGYMDYKEFQMKVALSEDIGVRPVFAARMLPKSWVHEVDEAGGFALILKYQLYPRTHRDLAKRVREELNLPVDTPRALADGTMERFKRWHRVQPVIP